MHTSLIYKRARTIILGLGTLVFFIIPSLASAASKGIWLSPSEIMALPVSGSAWNAVKNAANGSWGTADLSDNNSMHDVYTLAGALVAVRENNNTMRNKVIGGLQSAMVSDLDRALELSRGLQTYIIAADIIDYQDSAFKQWVRDMINAKVQGHGCSDPSGVIGTAECSANNWGGHARASLAAAGLYLSDSTMINSVVTAHKAFIGVSAPGNRMTYTNTTWHANSTNKAGVNRQGSTISGVYVSGVLPEDWRRSTDFQWPPVTSGYMWGGMSGYIVTAALLHRAGLVPFDTGNNAIKRSMDMLYGTGEAAQNNPVYKNSASGDDTWVPWVANFYLGTKYPTDPASPGKNMGWTDWTHSGSAGSTPPPTGDTTPPTVSITSPTNGATVSGSSVSVTANASDNVGVTSVAFKVDGATLFTDTTSPYAMTWNTTSATNGSHTLTAVASDAAGNTTTSSAVSVTVSNSGTPSSCSLLSSSTPVPTGFGASYNVLSTAQELLMKTTCDTSSAALSLGNGATTQYIYNKGYHWKNNAWQQFTYSCSNLIGGAWCVGNANSTISNLTSTELASTNHALGYICNWTGTVWKCGCRDSSCTTNYWNLQQFKK